VTREKVDNAVYEQKEGLESDAFKFKEDTREILKSRHTPPTMRDDSQSPEEEQKQ
jgi:hypothetical protein